MFVSSKFISTFVVLIPFFAVLYASALAVYMHTVLPSESLAVESPGPGCTFGALAHSPPFQTSERTS